MGAEWQEMLIEAVRRRPVLWEKSHIDFKDGRGVKRNNWVDVAAEVMLAVEGFTTTGSTTVNNFSLVIIIGIAVIALAHTYVISPVSLPVRYNVITTTTAMLRAWAVLNCLIWWVTGTGIVLVNDSTLLSCLTVCKIE